MKSSKIVLASGSPRRKDLMAEAGFETEIYVPIVDEKSVLDNNPRRLVIKEALLKNRASRQQFDLNGKTIVSADTIVYRGKEYTKPRDRANAIEILTELCGKWHGVYTGVVVWHEGEEFAFSVRSLVRLKTLSKKEIEDYVDTFKPFDKAGAYAIQENTVVDRWIGSYTNIVGLPMERLCNLLRRLGVTNNGQHSTVR